ncbi:MAG TPA: SMP-30/gluconolactonase/LRE family protein [Solirubrobacteraceae bacterium]|nr:SMP-30/gluconolactonase/LRE family protein [Solirubrobacteraceae bacterium]
MSSVRTLELLLDGGTFFEGPRWHSGRWYASDFRHHRVISVDPADGSWRVEMEVEVPSGLGWLPDGSLVAVSMVGHKLWRREANGTVALHADLSPLSRGEANDMVLDAHGRAYVGSYGFDLAAGADPAPAVLMRVDPDGSVHVAAEGLHFPNAAMITPDGNTLIVAETIAARFSAFTIDPGGGLRDRRIYAQIAPTPELTGLQETLAGVEFAPDGATLDAEGCLWTGDSLHHRAARISPAGEILEEIPAPEDRVFYGAMLGGPDGRTLLLTAAPDWRQARPDGELASELYTVQVDVPKAGLP